MPIGAQRFFYDPSPSGAGKPAHYGDPTRLRDDFFRAFDAGAALVAYTGHANYWQWGYTAPNVKPDCGSSRNASFCNRSCQAFGSQNVV